jgi:glycosyltransferase involved in cell wall biosynthesis
MKVAIVGPAHPYKGGAAQHTTALAHHLAEAGHDVTIESWSAQYPARLYPGEPTVDIDRPELPLFDPTRRDLSWRRPDGWFRHGRRIGKGSDLVVLMYHSPVQVPPYLSILKAAGRTRSVVIANNVTAHESRMADRTLTRALLRRVDAILVHAPDQAKEAGALSNKRVLLATLPAHFPEGSNPKPPEVTPDPDVHNSLLFFGLVRPYKGLDVLLRAMSVASAKPHLVVAGEFWQSEDEVRSLLSELCLSSRVTLKPGYVDAAEVPSLFRSVDALVLPYRRATGSQNAHLAFHHGRPVIATRTGALADSVQDGVNGIVSEPDDVDDLARAIDRFYQPGEALRLRAGVRGGDSSEEWKTYVEALVSVVPTGGI